MRHRLAYAYVLVAIGCSAPETRLDSVPSDSASIAAVLPGINVQLLDSGSATSPDGLRALRFSYTRSDGRWPYGWGFAVFAREAGSLRWLHLMIGDSPVHPPQLVDLDGDARSDLFALAGEETDFNTYIYLNRIAVDSFAVSNFGLGLRSDEVYAVLLDLDSDSVPELLFPEKQSDDYDLLAEDCEAPLRVGAFADRIDSEYRRVASRWQDANFDYGSARPGTINLFLTDSIRILSFVGQTRWAQARFPEHLNWRIALLSEAQESATKACRAQIADVISYLRSELDAP